MSEDLASCVRVLFGYAADGATGTDSSDDARKGNHTPQNWPFPTLITISLHLTITVERSPSNPLRPRYLTYPQLQLGLTRWPSTIMAIGRFSCSRDVDESGHCRMQTDPQYSPSFQKSGKCTVPRSMMVYIEL